jgi:hypothetical protein
MSYEKKKIASPTINAPTSSGIYTPEEENKQLNTRRLFAALLRLKRLEVSGEVRVEKSLDGSSEIYVRSGKEQEKSAPESPSVTSSPWTLHETPVPLDSILQRLRALAESQKESSAPDTPPYNLQVSLDNCTLFYIPAETIETHENFENLPNSYENQTPTEPYYNLTSPSTLKFIQRALLNKSKNATPNSHDLIVQESLDKSILIIHPKGPLPKITLESPGYNDISRPDLAEILKKKLEELKIDGEVQHAIDDESIQIITLNISPYSASGSQSSKENSTPVLSRSDYPNLLSPKTNSKLIRKLHEVQEDLEGEDEGIRDIGGHTTLFLGVEDIQPMARFQFSPRNNNVPNFQEVAEKLAKLKRRTYSW